MGERVLELLLILHAAFEKLEESGGHTFRLR